MGEYKYKAFISYSHKDKQWARWLHRRLETYTFPKYTTGKQTKFGAVPKNLKPIFRDRDELAAADDLGKKIEDALSQSENLIIICSPAAARSHWVNQEVLFFKRHNRGAKIFSVIVDGEPFATNLHGPASDECLPPALRLQVDSAGELTNIPAEPLAADLRPQGDGKRLGLLKLISGMVGLGLDDLVQRDLHRARRRVTAITASAISAVLVMASLTWLAMDARQEAETRRAEAEAQRTLATKRTASAEELIEFMVTDLKDKLEPVGRLDALKVVGEKASQYYDQYPLAAHDDDALGRRARVFHYLGEIQDKLGNLDDADDYFQRAYTTTKDLLARDPENPDRIFEHAQSAYWAGYALWKMANYEDARRYFDAYIVQAEGLQKVEPNTLRGLQEVTYAHTNLGTLLLKEEEFDQAKEIYSKALPAYELIAKSHPGNIQYQLDLANAYGWMSDVNERLIPTDRNKDKEQAAFEFRKKQIAIYSDAKTIWPKNLQIEYEELSATVGLVRLLRKSGHTTEALELANQGYKSSRHLFEGGKDNTQWGENSLYFLYETFFLAIELSDHESAKNSIREINIIESTIPMETLREPEKMRNLRRATIEQYTDAFSSHEIHKQKQESQK